MNMLVIGNGFDLAHGRPTTYSDFLRFLHYILSAQEYTGDKAQFESNLEIKCPAVRQYILSSFDTRKNPKSKYVGNTNNAIQELYNCLDKNVWYDYFKGIWMNDQINGKNWIDFEQEILEVIDFFDHGIYNIYNPISDNIGTETDSNRNMDKLKRFWNLFCVKIKEEGVKRCLWSDFIDKTYRDLQDLVRCLEIYLDDCIKGMRIGYFSPDIKELELDFILSFNYSTIPTDIYPSFPRNKHYIHGYAAAERPAVDNNMILGVNEYWHGDDKNTHTNFNLYKKFVQRIIKKTGIDYKMALNHIKSFENGRENAQKSRENHIYIFGHSLDITDGDILREVIETDDTKTIIFFRDEPQQSRQIANLSKVLGQEKLLDCVFSTSPTIIFQKQAEMIELPTT